ncbi:cytochrome P450 [Plenodomus tracheiphilus IPT5]|uniref:Cytochrome P450 n=1 Tax=Plenodomus tracheiphilus IPT5 TaxID=1408161 RepID=A0A6A7BAT5_9PLEO|nr:cytochrome P450 [Plenodomus tracheiphilus IPT5]
MVRAAQVLALATSKPVAAGLALATHAILHQGEWDNEFHLVLRAWTLALGGLATAEYIYDPHVSSIGTAIRITSVTAAVYMSVFITSILIHRAFFHRLRHIPGPFLARCTKFYSVFVGVLPKYQYFKWTEKLHEQYKTDVIRTGPREVTVYCADAVTMIHGPNTRCRKGPWYAISKHIGGASTQTTRDKEEHRRRRKNWDYAFNAKALRDYEPRLNRHAMALMTRLKEQSSQPVVRFTNWVNFYSFDVMGDVGFSRSFGMMEKGEEADVIKLLHASMEPLSIFGHLTWGLNLITRTAFGAKDLIKHIDWTAMVLEKRKKVIPKEKDVFSWLLDENYPNVTPELNADSRLLIVAGSDTTAASLSWLTYELCKNPKVQSKLRTEIDTAVSKKGFLNVDDVANIPYLDGVINETLRLHPAVPSGVQRETPPEGITLPNGTYIPGTTIIWMPIHTMQRDARYFASPLTFLPERWTAEQPSAILDKRAFMPFGYGSYSCVGQKLAMMELRSVVANLVRGFEVDFAEGERGEAIEGRTRDCFTINVGKLDVRLSVRGEKA